MQYYNFSVFLGHLPQANGLEAILFRAVFLHAVSGFTVLARTLSSIASPRPPANLRGHLTFTRRMSSAFATILIKISSAPTPRTVNWDCGNHRPKCLFIYFVFFSIQLVLPLVNKCKHCHCLLFSLKLVDWVVQITNVIVQFFCVSFENNKNTSRTSRGGHRGVAGGHSPPPDRFREISRQKMFPIW